MNARTERFRPSGSGLSRRQLLHGATAALAAAALAPRRAFGRAEAGSPGAGAGAGTLIRSREPGWPQWRGPRRDGASEETGLPATWPASGPKLAWKAAENGRGYSSPIVAGDSIFVTGDAGEDLQIAALGPDGTRRWRVTNGKSWKQPHPGSRSACTYDGGKLYHLNAHGRLVCLEAATGKEAWVVDVVERFGADKGIWGMAESPVVDGTRVFVTAVGTKALMAALDARTGATLWTSPPLPEEKHAYSSPILLEFGGRRLLVNQGMRHAFAVDAETGAVLWTHRHPIPENTVGATPVFAGDSLFFGASSRDVSAIYCLRLGAGGQSVEQGWSQLVKCGHGGAVWSGDRLFAASARGEGGGWAAIDPRSGTVVDVEGAPPIGSAAAGDGRLYVLGQEGEAALLQPTAAGGKVASRFRFVEAPKKDAWTHPVICGGRMLLRYHETLCCYDLKA